MELTKRIYDRKSQPIGDKRRGPYLIRCHPFDKRRHIISDSGQTPMQRTATKDTRQATPSWCRGLATPMADWDEG